jgi:hypothetical protein
MPGNTPMWGNPMRERYFISFKKYISAATIQFSARDIHLHHTKTSPKYYALENVPNMYCCTTYLENKTLENVPIVCCTDSYVQPCCSKKNPPTTLKCVPQFASIFVNV